MVLVASIRGLGQGVDLTAAEEREASARRWGNKLFIPALTVPILTVAGTFAFKRFTVNGVALVDVKQVTVIALAIATLIALAVWIALLRAGLSAPVQETTRARHAGGSGAAFPQMLAAPGV